MFNYLLSTIAQAYLHISRCSYMVLVWHMPIGHKEASVVQWLCHSPCKPGVAGSIPVFSSPSNGTINRGPVSI